MKTRTIEQFCEQQAWVVQDGYVVGLGVLAIAVKDYAASPLVMADSPATEDKGFGKMFLFPGGTSPALFGKLTTRTWPKWCEQARN